MGVEHRKSLYGYDVREPDLRRSNNRTHREIKSLWSRNHEIINLAVRGHKSVDIAKILNINISTVSDTLNSELGERKLSELRFGRDEEAKVVGEKIRVLTDRALAVYHEFFDDVSGEVGLKDKREGAKDFLNDMSGLRAPTRVQSLSASVQLTREELEEFKQRGIQAAKDSGMIVEEAEIVEAETV